MSLVSRLKDAFARANRKIVASQEVSNRIFVNPQCSTYENLFAQVRPLINDMKAVFPYGVGRNGAPRPLNATPELSVLRAPNDDMGWAEFADLAFATYLTEKELNIHVWRNGRGRVYGYSILPVGCREVIGGETRFAFVDKYGHQNILSRDEVMTLRYSRSPLNADEGVSPATAIYVYTQIDDVIAQYIRAYFENGAIPASITFIKASTKEGFESKKKELERGLHGARNKNKTLYIWRAYNRDSGDTDDEIEVKTIQSTNSTLALKEIITIVTDKLNKSVGVSNFILGDDSSAKYSNAELSDYQFVKRRVYPTLLSFWDQFQHELDRITGGIGYAIQFDLELPELTDRAKTKAETARINTESLKMMIESGATPSSAVAALGLGSDWRHVADGIYARALSTLTLQQAQPSLADKVGKIQTQKTLADSATKKSTNGSVYTPVFQANEADEKAIYDELMRIANAIADEVGIPAEEVREAITEILVKQANDGGKLGAETIYGLLGSDKTAEDVKNFLENEGYAVSDEFRRDLKNRVDDLVNRFSEDTQELVREVLTNAREEGVTASQLRSQLSEVLPRHRAEMIARNETVHAFRAGRLATDDDLASRFNLKIAKTWRCTNDNTTCPICRAMDGQTVSLRDAFTDEITVDAKLQKRLAEYGQKVDVGDVLAYNHTHWNNNGEIPNAHVNCRCSFDEEVVG